LRQLGGALSRPAPGAGALSHLDGAFVLFCGGLTADVESTAEAADAAAAVIERLRPWHAGRRYLNLTERPVDLRDAYDADTYERLAALHRTLDPHGVVRANHSLA
jgi:hypothetical protein